MLLDGGPPAELLLEAFYSLQREGVPLLLGLANIARNLDSDFFAGRWARATVRHRELLRVIAGLEHTLLTSSAFSAS